MAVLFAQPIEEYPVHLATANAPSMSNADAAYPATRLLTYDPTSVARTTTGSTVINWDYGLLREFDVVALVYTNTSYAATIKVEASVDSNTWVVLQDTNPLWAHRTTVPASWVGEANDPRRGALVRNSSWYYSPTVLRYRYLRLTVADPNVTQITIGRLFVGRSFSPATGMQYGTAFNFSDNGARERTDKGALMLDPGSTTVTASVKLDFLSTAEMYDYVYEFDYWRGSCREVLVCLDTNDIPRLQKNLFYATLTDGRTINADAFNVYSKTWTIESIA